MGNFERPFVVFLTSRYVLHDGVAESQAVLLKSAFFCNSSVISVTRSGIQTTAAQCGLII